MFVSALVLRRRTNETEKKKKSDKLLKRVHNSYGQRQNLYFKNYAMRSVGSCFVAFRGGRVTNVCNQTAFV
ncbi:hypothetical protein PGB90_009387 [Kerria lacca]